MNSVSLHLPTKVAASDEVSKNVAIAASAAQDAYGVIQTVSAKYWDPAKTFGEMIAQGSISATDEKSNSGCT